MINQFAIGDRVAMSARFLRSISDFRASTANRRGKVQAISHIAKDRSLVTIWWDDGFISKALNTNLVHADRIHLEPR